jgi:hypothetical protein
MKSTAKLRVLALAAILLLPFSSSAQLVCQGSASATAPLEAELRYRLLDYFRPVRFCDPDCAGPCRLDVERRNAERALVQLRTDNEAFRAITHRLGFEGTDGFSDEQKLTIYGEYKKLSCGMRLESEGGQYKFTIPSANGFRIEGFVNKAGAISVIKKTHSALYCPK